MIPISRGASRTRRRSLVRAYPLKLSRSALVARVGHRRGATSPTRSSAGVRAHRIADRSATVGKCRPAVIRHVFCLECAGPSVARQRAGLGTRDELVSFPHHFRQRSACGQLAKCDVPMSQSTGIGLPASVKKPATVCRSCFQPIHWSVTCGTGKRMEERVVSMLWRKSNPFHPNGVRHACARWRFAPGRTRSSNQKLTRILVLERLSSATCRHSGPVKTSATKRSELCSSSTLRSPRAGYESVSAHWHARRRPMSKNTGMISARNRPRIPGFTLLTQQSFINPSQTAFDD